MGDAVTIFGIYLQSLITARKAAIARAKKMREIKFRLIRDGQIVGYEKHTKSENAGIEIYHSAVNDDCDGWAWVNVLILRSAWITHDTKEQFTGLLDSAGREIYEGDR